LNSFEPQHYVPILRWKEAERGALSQLDTHDLTHITPLIELIPENFVQNEKRLPNEAAMYWVAGQLTQCWDERPIYMDLLNLPPALIPQSGKCLTLLAGYVGFSRFSLIPVTGLHRESSYNIAVRDVVETMNQGACLRLTLEDLRSATLDQSVSDLISLLSLKHKEMDLLVDCDTIDSSLPKINDLCRLIPDGVSNGYLGETRLSRSLLTPVCQTSVTIRFNTLGIRPDVQAVCVTVQAFVTQLKIVGC